MKKINLFFLLFSTSIILSAQTNILDGDLNNWTRRVTPAPDNREYYQPTNGFLSTLNELADVPQFLATCPITTERTSDVFSAPWAAKLTSKNFQLGSSWIFVSGLVGTVRIDFTTQIAYLGRAYTYTEKPRRFKGYFKYESVNNDSCLLLVLLTKHNSITNHRDTLGILRKTYTGNFSTYTQFDLPITYNDDITTPDSITILTASSAGINFSNMQACVGQLNSIMYIDELSFSMQAGIEMPLQNDVSVSLYPIPANNIINISSEHNLQFAELKVYDINGKLLIKKQLNTDNTSIDINNLLSGKYLYQIFENSRVINAGSFMVKR